MGWQRDLLKQSMARISNATDQWGGEKLTSWMHEQAREWERTGYITLRPGEVQGIIVARITEKGRKVAAQGYA
jgi:hypothetical protein